MIRNVGLLADVRQANGRCEFIRRNADPTLQRHTRATLLLQDIGGVVLGDPADAGQRQHFLAVRSGRRQPALGRFQFLAHMVLGLGCQLERFACEVHVQVG